MVIGTGKNGTLIFAETASATLPNTARTRLRATCPPAAAGQRDCASGECRSLLSAI